MVRVPVGTPTNWGWSVIGPGDVGAASATDFDAHLSETVITADRTINVPSDFSTIQAALDSLKKAWIPRDVTVVIQVAAGTYTQTSAIIVDHPCGSRVKIIGATPVTTTITGVGTITGSAGNWSVPVLVQSTSGMAAGDYAIIRDTTGTGDHYAFRGIWKVLSVDSATQITVQNTHRASTFPTATLSGGTVVGLKSILKFTNCDGIVVGPNSVLGLLDQVAVVGDGSVYNGILARSIATGQGVPTPAFICLGGNMGVNGFGGHGMFVGCGAAIFAYSGVAVSGNGYSGFYVGNGSSVWAGSGTASGNGHNGFCAAGGSFISADSSTASGNGYSGFGADNCGSISAVFGTASGNGYDGFSGVNGSSIRADFSTASGNGHNGFWAGIGSSIRAGSSTASSNGECGYSAYGGGSIWAALSTASGNTDVDYRAFLESSVYVYGYTGMPTFSPALNTVGNQNSIIST